MDDRPATDALGMPAEQMRELGHWVVDRVVDHFATLAERPAIRTGEPASLLERLGGPLPEEPGDARAALEALTDVAFEHMQHGDHPRYFARVPGPSSFSGVLGDWLSTGFNALASSWGGGAGPATVELVAIDWLAALLGLPRGWEGLLVSGGSLANMTALAVARAQRGAGVAYLCDQTHASIRRALLALGWSAEQIRTLGSDERLRMDARSLADAVAADRRRGQRPAVAIATAGTTNTGAVDELEGIASVCAAEGLWLHVDGAYGAAAAACDAGRRALAGLELADSLVVDPHKWLFAPYDAGLVLVRHAGALERTFAMRPEYLADVQLEPGTVDFGNRGLELSRRARAVKLWLTLRMHGARALRDAVARGIELALIAQGMLERDPPWRVVTPAQLGIVTFTRDGWDAGEHAAAVARLTGDGYAALTSTSLRGRPALRLCTINPRTTEADLEGTLRRLAELGPRRRTAQTGVPARPAQAPAPPADGRASDGPEAASDSR
ncbi:MAG TPA: aminotransferase class I/II-fold pyridoxal phosphate-dependent enzyme [Solirubrobacteraceae bacterium]|nr:aminotransferase class I/II-fold pyridoxal phosphate-dependent enzyme [Solirubrobacteraceae bacterium]